METKVLIDARTNNKDGIGRYSQNLLRTILEENKKQNFYKFIDNRNICVKTHSYTLDELYERQKLVDSIQPKLYHSLEYKAPLTKKDYKLILTVHDIFRYTNKAYCYSDISFVEKFGEERFEELKKASDFLCNFVNKFQYTYSYHHTYYLNYLFHSLSLSDYIITCSAFVKKQILLNFRFLNKSRIRLVYHGLDHVNNQHTKMTYANKYLLYYGQDRSHKNVDKLIYISEKLDNIKFYFVGNDFSKYKSSSNCKFFGTMSDKNLFLLMNNATAIINLSDEEGFGFTLAEGAFLNKPIISSKYCETHRELFGSNAYYVDTQSIDNLQNDIMKSCHSLREPSLSFIKNLTWKSTYLQTEEVYNVILNEENSYL